MNSSIGNIGHLLHLDPNYAKKEEKARLERDFMEQEKQR
jgi:hypothetical protein